MTGAGALERRYRRLLRLFPARYRSEHEEEMLAVLMASATDGQRRPRLADSADLVMSAVFLHWREITRQPRWAWERRHWRLVVRVRVASGVWLLILGSIVLAEGGWWGVFFLPPALLHFYLAHRVRQAARAGG
jgi:hypothetical protein